METPLQVQHVTPAARKLQPSIAAKANQARALVKAEQFQEAAGLFQELEAAGALEGSCSLWLARSVALHGIGDASGCQNALAPAEAYCNTPQVCLHCSHRSSAYTWPPSSLGESTRLTIKIHVHA